MINLALDPNIMSNVPTTVIPKDEQPPVPRRKRRFLPFSINFNLFIAILIMIVFLLLILLIVFASLYNAIVENNQTRTTPIRATVTGQIPVQTQECGRAAQKGRIMNGEIAGDNSWPWVVSLRLRSGSKIGEHVCGGSLIFTNMVITAAHCVFKHMPERLAVIVGSNNLSVSSSSSQRIKLVADFIYHSGFDRQEIVNDIAILRLTEPVELSPSVSVICLPPLDEDPTAIYDKPVVVVGWGSISGTDSQSSLSPTLKQSMLKIVNTKSICTRSNTNNNYCALDETNSSNACYGDSGGPLMHLRDDGRWYLYGITSFVLTQASKCYPSLPSFYTIIPNYLDWIGNILTTLTAS